MIRYLVAVLCLALVACGGDPRTSAPQGDPGPYGAQLNAFRSSQHLPPLRFSAPLQRAAEGHVADLEHKSRLSHRGSDGSTLATRVRGQGYAFSQVAENLAMTPGDIDDAMWLWIHSPGHYANLILPGVTDYGLAREGQFWVLVLARPL